MPGPVFKLLLLSNVYVVLDTPILDIKSYKYNLSYENLKNYEHVGALTVAKLFINSRFLPSTVFAFASPSVPSVVAVSVPLAAVLVKALYDVT